MKGRPVRANLGPDWIRLNALLHQPDLSSEEGDEARALVDAIVRRRLVANEIPKLVEDLGPLLEVWRRGGVGRARGATDAEYAALAALYSAIVASGALHPIEMLAESLGGRAPVLNRRVTEARKMGLLGPTKRGQPGGEVTAQGVLILEVATGGRW